MRGLLVVLLGMTLTSALPAQESVPPGKATFDVVCASCHSIDPPHKLAPPMRHVARYYRQHFGTEDAFVDAVVQWVTRPDSARSRMPAHVIERFGLMAAFPLPEPQLREVARYVWALSDQDSGTRSP